MPNKRLPPTKRIDNEINALRYNLGESAPPQDVFGKLVKLAMKRIVQEILENEVSDFTGRDYYKHSGEGQGHRNGYEPSTLRTAEGHLDIQRPQVRNATVPFESQTWPHLKKNTQQLEHMAVEMYVNGCSTRDIEDLLKDDHGRILRQEAASAGSMKRSGPNTRNSASSLSMATMWRISSSTPSTSPYVCSRAVLKPS